MKRLAKKLKRKLLKIAKQWVKYWALNRLLPRAYAKAAQAPVAPDKVVFVENKQADLSDSYKVIYERLTHDYTFDVRFVSLGQNRVRFKKYFRNCEAMLQEIATAKYVFLNDASDVVSCVDLRPETKVVQLWHACGAFKKWGMSTADLIFGGSRKDLLRHPFYKNLSLVTVSSPEVEWAYREAMVLEDRPQVVQPLGVSRTDLFFDSDYLAGMRERIEQLVPECAGKKIILYAPTFRGRVAKAEGPDQLNIRAMKQALGDEYVLMIKHHPFVKNLPPIPDDCQDFAFQMSGGIAAIDQLLTVADVCISDYSSLVFEYSLFERPMIFFAYDLADYGDWRGFYYDYDQLTPGPVLTDTAQIIDYVQHLDTRFDKQEVVDFKQRFMSACDGHATDRICQAVFGEDLEIYRRPTAAEVLRAQNPDGKDISIIIPAYNAMPKLNETLASIERQTYDHARMQLIVVDDGSADGTGEAIDAFAAQHPDYAQAIHLPEASGSPAKPRNMGLAAATGCYVFFLDADDYLGDAAVEKMLDHAVDWKSDVLYVKLFSDEGRDVPESMFQGDQPQADLFHSKVLWSIGPLKLFSRSLLQDNNLHFFEGGMPEDIQLVIPALCLADTVSVAADYDYYHVGWDGGESNTSSSIWDDAESNLRSYRSVMDFIDAHVSADDQDGVLMRRLFRRDVYYLCLTIATKYSGCRQEALYGQMKEMFGPFYRPGNYRTCPLDKRLVLDAALLGSLDKLVDVVRAGGGLAARCTFDNEDAAILCHTPEDTGGIVCDITDAVPFEYELLGATASEDGVRLSGTLQGIGGVQATEAALVAVRQSDGARFETPCTLQAGVLRIEDVAGADTTYLQDHTWGGMIDFGPLADLAPAATGDSKKDDALRRKDTWHLYLRVWAHAAVWDVRIGAHASAAARRCFLTGFVSCGESAFNPYCTEFGNYCYEQKRNA